MKNDNYKKNLRLYGINIIVFLSLLLVLSGKIINTTKVYGQYKEGKKAYAMEDYIATQSIYSEIYNKTKFNFFSKEIKDILKTEEITFIKDSIVFLEDIKDRFTTEAGNNAIATMLEIHHTFDTRLAGVKESSNQENLVNYNALVDQYNLKSLFLTEFENIVKGFQADINKSIEAEDFIEEIDFNLYAQVLGKTASNLEDENKLEEDMKKYYVAKVDWLIKEDNLEDLLVETQQIANDYSNFMEVEWAINKATAVTTRKMEESIADKNYTRYRTLGLRYFNYLSQLPSELSNRNEVKVMVSNQLESDYKQLKGHIANNKFEEATQLYDAMEEYIVIADNQAIDMEGLKQEIDIVWMKNDPIRMFSPLVLTEIAKGKSEWGKDAYVLATDANRDTLYWGEINSQQETKQLQVDISGYAVHDMYIHGDLSSGNKPVVIIEETDGYGGKHFSGYRIEENSIVKILNMDADYFEVKKQGNVLIGRESNSTDISYYELTGGEYTKLFDFGDIQIENTDYYYSPISAVKNVYSYDEIEYITASANIYNGHSSNSLAGSIGINYKDPNGNIMYNDQSSGNYSWEAGVNTSTSQQITRGLTANYNFGVHIVEFWWDGIKIGQTQFSITQ